MRNLRPTDLPFNKRVVLPESILDDTEQEIQTLKTTLTKVTRTYIQGNKNTNANSNLTHKEKTGLKQLKNRDDVVIFQTDKSGRFAIDTKENYIKATETHYINDTTITEAEHSRCQK